MKNVGMIFVLVFSGKRILRIDNTKHDSRYTFYYLPFNQSKECT